MIAKGASDGKHLRGRERRTPSEIGGLGPCHGEFHAGRSYSTAPEVVRWMTEKSSNHDAARPAACCGGGAQDEPATGSLTRRRLPLRRSGPWCQRARRALILLDVLGGKSDLKSEAAASTVTIALNIVRCCISLPPAGRSLFASDHRGFPMTATDLQFNLFHFAAGRPAIAISKDAIIRAVTALRQQLQGVYPDQPAAFMRNAKLPVYNLAYSVFIDRMELIFLGDTPLLDVALRATIHPYNDIPAVIATYAVTLNNPVPLRPSYASSTRNFRWIASSTPTPQISPSMSPNAEQILRAMTVPEPVLDTFERKVETPILWNTSNTFVQLVLDALPEYDLGEIAPWLTMLDPLLTKVVDNHMLLTSDKARMSIGTCSPVDVIIEPDPNFPYGEPEPVAATVSRATIAVYLPKTRLLSFVSENVQPAVLVDTGDRGGLIKWRIAGAFGLQRFSLDVTGGILRGYSGNLTLRGLLSAHAELGFVGVARAWVDGPCGSHIGLANADVIGSGQLDADISLTYRVADGTMTADLIVTHTDLNSRLDIDHVGWPMDDIISELAEYLAKGELRKLSGTISRLGKWEVLRLPDWMLATIPTNTYPAPTLETLQSVSSLFALWEEPNG